MIEQGSIAPFSGTPLLRVEGVRVRAARDQEAGHLDVIGGCRKKQGGSLPVVTRLDIGPGAQGAIGCIGLAGRGRAQELAIRLVDLGGHRRGPKWGRTDTRRRTDVTYRPAWPSPQTIRITTATRPPTSMRPINVVR